MTGQVQRPRSLLWRSVVTTGVCLAGGILGWQVVAEDAAGNPHEPHGESDGALCTSCHREAPERLPEGTTRTVLPDPDGFVVDPVAMCVSCHEEDAESHPVGARPDYPVPADLPLDKDGQVSCLTCHYTHGSVESDHQCASASLLDRLLNRERLRKSYLLRRDNAHGELCKACHETDAEKKETRP